ERFFLFAQGGEQLGEVLVGRGGIHHQHIGDFDGLRDRRERFLYVVAQALVDEFIEIMAGCGNQQGVAVGTRFGHGGGRDGGVRPGLVLYEDRLFPAFGQFVRDQSGRLVDRAAWQVTDDQGDGAGGVVDGE